MNIKSFLFELPFYILLFLSCMNYGGRGPVVYLFFCVYGILFYNNYKVSRLLKYQVTPFVCLTVVACFTAFIFGGEKEAVKPINILLSYLLGLIIMSSAEKRFTRLKVLSFVAFLGFLSNLLLIYYLNFIVIGHNQGFRMLYNYWTRELFPGTIVGMLSAFIIGFSFYCIFCRRSIIYWLFAIFGLFLTAYINNETATRTPFFLFAVVLIFVLYYRLEVVSKRYWLYIFVGSIFIYLLFFDVSSFLKNVLSESAFVDRFEETGIQTTRVDISLQYLNVLWLHPFGGNFGEEIVGYSPHNFIQEIGNSYGIIPMLCILIITLRIVVAIYNMYKREHNNPFIETLLYMLLPLFLQCLTEPVNSAYPQIFWLMILYFGMYKRVQCDVDKSIGQLDNKKK